MSPRDLLTISDRDVVDLVDLKADAAVEAAAVARADGNEDRVDPLMREAVMWLAIREELTRAGVAA